MGKRVPIKQRIRAALGDGKLGYIELARRVLPEDQYPKAWNYQSNGGPPGCYMALSNALREMAEQGESHDWSNGVGPANRWVQLREQRQSGGSS